jgi:PAS domain S-box-containing protein
MPKALEHMTRAELIEFVRELQSKETEQALRRTILELQVYREEVRQQNEELIATQRDLEWSRNRYVELYDSAPIGYVTLDLSGIITEINLTGAQMLGYPVKRLVGRPFLSVVDNADVFLGHLSRCKKSNGDDVVSEVELRGAEGRALSVEIRSRVVTGDDCLFVRTTLSDLSERRRAEEQRRTLELRAQVAQEANEAKDRLLAVLSHELRNPLAAISAGASLLAEIEGLPERVAAAVERIRRNVAAEARLINDLLDASRLRHGKLRMERQAVDLHVVVEDAVAALRAERPELQLHVALAAAHPFVQGDAMRLGQVVSNLLRNARDATAQGGSISVATADGPDGLLRLSVADTGCGIEAADLARIFDPFEQSGRADGELGGLGLGLAICKSLVEAHGGTVHAQSGGRGRGATFEVELPALVGEARARVAPRAPAARPPASPMQRILLVDDHQDTAESLAMLLRQRGFEVAVAHSVASALERAAEGFDLLISDLGLPDGNGHELLQRIAARAPLRAIALSGYGGEADIAASRAAGFDAHLVKPVDAVRLLGVIDRVAAA